MTPRAIVLFALGPIGSAILGLAIVPLSAWAFAAEDIGRLNLLQTISALAVTGAFLGLDQAYVREFNESTDRRGLATLALGTAVLIFITAALPFSLHATWTSETLYDISSPWLTWASLLSILLALLLRQWTLVARMGERPTSFLWAQLGPRLVMLIGLGLVLLTQLMPGFEVLLWINVACNLAGVLILGIALSRDVVAVRPRPGSRRLLGRMLKYSVPLALSAFAYVALTSSNTFIVRVQAGFDELGIFAVSLGVASAAAIVQQIFSVIWSPVVYRALAQGDVTGVVGRMQRLVLGLFGTALALAGTFSWVVDLVLAPQYSAVKFLSVGLVFVPLAYMVREVVGIGIMITKKTGYALVGNVVGLLVMTGLSSWLTPQFGAYGAVAAAISAFWCILVFSTEASARIWHAYPRIELYAVTGTGALLSLVTLWMGTHGASWFIIFWVIYGGVVFARTHRVMFALFRRGDGPEA